MSLWGLTEPLHADTLRPLTSLITLGLDRLQADVIPDSPVQSLELAHATESDVYRAAFEFPKLRELTLESGWAEHVEAARISKLEILRLRACRFIEKPAEAACTVDFAWAPDLEDLFEVCTSSSMFARPGYGFAR